MFKVLAKCLKVQSFSHCETFCFLSFARRILERLHAYDENLGKKFGPFCNTMIMYKLHVFSGLVNVK